MHFHWRADHDGPGRPISLNVYFTIPEGVTVRFESALLHLESPDWSEPRDLAIQTITAAGPQRFNPDELLIGPRDRARQMHTLWYILPDHGYSTQTDIPFVPEFSVTLPSIRINGEAWQPGTIGFRAIRRWGMYTCIQ